MAGAGGYAFSPRAERAQVLSSAAIYDNKFAEAVPDFDHSRRLPLVGFVSFLEGAVSHLAKARRGVRAGSASRRLNFEDIEAIAPPLSHEALIEAVEPRWRNRVRKAFQSEEGYIPEKTFAALSDAIVKLRPELSERLLRYGRLESAKVAGLSSRSRAAMAQQKEAVSTAMMFSGIDPAELQKWSVPDKPLNSFLGGLDHARLREDQVIINDLTSLPGFDLLRKTITGTAEFSSGETKLTVIIANRLPLEEQTGADLIYFNETFNSFVLVQYKMLEPSNNEHSFSLPNDDLTKQIALMDSLYAQVAHLPVEKVPSAYRLTDVPFFLKFCPRITFNPDASGLSSGMYLPIELWKILETHSSLRGEKGGMSLTTRNAGRYMENAEFISLVRKAWIGSTPPQAAVLREIFRMLIQNDRSLVIARRRDGPPPPPPGSSILISPTSHSLETPKQQQQILLRRGG